MERVRAAVSETVKQILSQVSDIVNAPVERPARTEQLSHRFRGASLSGLRHRVLVV